MLGQVGPVCLVGRSEREGGGERGEAQEMREGSRLSGVGTRKIKENVETVLCTMIRAKVRTDVDLPNCRVALDHFQASVGVIAALRGHMHKVWAPSLHSMVRGWCVWLVMIGPRRSLLKSSRCMLPSRATQAV